MAESALKFLDGFVDQKIGSQIEETKAQLKVMETKIQEDQEQVAKMKAKVDRLHKLIMDARLPRAKKRAKK